MKSSFFKKTFVLYLPKILLVVVADGDDEDVRSKGVLEILLDRTPAG